MRLGLRRPTKPETGRGRAFARLLAFGCFFVALTFTGSAGARERGGLHPAGVSGRSAFPETVVRFSFRGVTSSPGEATYVVSGSGKMEFFQPLQEGAPIHAQVGYNKSTITIYRGGSSATLQVFSNGYRYGFTYGQGGKLRQGIYLFGDITRSTIRAFHVGSAGRIHLYTAEDDPTLDAVIFDGFPAKPASVTITPTPRPSSQPTKLTLTVNTTTAVATTTNNSIHETAPQVAPKSNLTIKATLDKPLPAGWTMVVFHNGDPKSQGNGNYYELCHLTGTATPTTNPPECADTRPTFPSPNDDYVSAQVRAPTGFNMYIQIYIPVR